METGYPVALVTTYVYEANNHRTLQYNNDGTRTTCAYDDVGDKLAVLERGGRRVSYSYDGLVSSSNTEIDRHVTLCGCRWPPSVLNRGYSRDSPRFT